VKILCVTTGYPRFSGDTFGCFIDDVVRGLAKEDKVTVLAPHAQNFPWREHHEGLTIYRLPYFFLSGRVAYGGGIPTNLKNWSCRIQLPFFMMAMCIYTIFFSRRYDLIHAHWGVTAWMALPASKLWRKKLVVSYHGSDLHGSRLIQKASRSIAKFCVEKICVSQEQAEHLGAKCSVISYGLDAERFCPVEKLQKIILREKYGFSQAKFVVLYVGYLIPLKRVHLLIESLPHLPDHVELCIVGDGPLRTELENLAKKIDVEQRVKFLGTLPYHHIHEVFQMSDVHSLVSEREGKPNVVYQAMASGCSSVVTRAGGTVEQVVEGETGLFVEGDVKDLTRALNQMLVDDLSAVMGVEARERLMGLGIDLATIVDDHRRLYRRL
jgi:glycosyltransferase involved in cell wall biosynthesis